MTNVDYSLGLSQTHDITKLREICQAINQPFESADLGVLRRRIRNACKLNASLIPIVCRLGGWNPKLSATPGKDIEKKTAKNKENVDPDANSDVPALVDNFESEDRNPTPTPGDPFASFNKMIQEQRQIDAASGPVTNGGVLPPITSLDAPLYEILPQQTQFLPPITLIHSTPITHTSVADSSVDWNQFANIGGSKIPRTPTIPRQELAPPKVNPVFHPQSVASTIAATTTAPMPIYAPSFNNPLAGWNVYEDPSYAGLPPPATVSQPVSTVATSVTSNAAVASSVVNSITSAPAWYNKFLTRTTAPSQITSVPQSVPSHTPGATSISPVSTASTGAATAASMRATSVTTPGINTSVSNVSPVPNHTLNTAPTHNLPPITGNTDQLTAILTVLAQGQQTAAQQTQMLTNLLNTSLQLRENSSPGHPVSPLLHLLRYAQEREIYFESREHGKPLNSFIKEIEDLLKLYTQVSKEDFMKIFPKLLKGKAKAAFKANPKAFATWDEAKDELKDAFSSGKSPLHELSQFFLKVQRPDESTEEYIARRVTENKRLENPLSTNDLFSPIVEGLDTEVKKKVDKRNISTLPALVELARKLDKERKAELARQELLPAHLRSVTPPASPSRTPPVTPPRNSPRPSPSSSPRPQSSGETSRRSSLSSNHSSRNSSNHSSPNRNSPAKPGSPNVNRTLRFSDETKTYEPAVAMFGRSYDQSTQCEFDDECACAPVDPYPTEPTGVPPLGSQLIPHAKYGFQCWNCYSTEHRFKQCPSPRTTIFCYKCGRKGFKLSDCPQHGNQPEVAPVSITPSPQLFCWNAQLQSYVPYQPSITPATVYQPPTSPVVPPQPQINYAQHQVSPYVAQPVQSPIQPPHQAYSTPPQINIDASYYRQPEQSSYQRLPYTKSLSRFSDAEIARIPSVSDPYPETDLFCTLPIRPPTPPIQHEHLSYSQVPANPHVAPMQPATPRPPSKVSVAKRPEIPKVNPAPRKPQPTVNAKSNPVPHVPGILRTPNPNSSVSSRDYEKRPAEVAVTYMSPAHNALRFTVDVNIGGKNYQALVDTGSTDTVIHPDVAKDLKSQGLQFEPTQIKARLADGHTSPISEIGQVPLRFGNKVWLGDAMVLPALPFDVVIGMTVLNAFAAVINLGTKTITLYDKFGALDIAFQWMGKPARVAKEYSTGPVPISIAVMFLAPFSSADLEERE